VGSTLFLLLILLLNVGIAYWNARVCGPVWRYRHEMDWGTYLVSLSAVLMSVVGFSMPLLLGETFLFQVLGILPAAGVKVTTGIWYLTVIVPVLGASIILTAHSLIEAWKRRDLASGAVAAWNTGSTIHNLASAPSGIADAGSSIMDGLADDEGGFILVLAIFIVATSLFGGAFATYAVMKAHRNDRIVEA
jgi:hypothetical protein